MPINTDDLQRLKDDYKEAAGKDWSAYFCPVLLEEGVGAGLMDGHIIPEALKTAARATVIQRADVDNHFGGTVEPDFIDFLNSITFTKAEFLAKAKDVSLTPPGGTPARPFTANTKRSQPPFPRISLVDEQEGVVAAPFVKTTWENLGGQLGVVQVQGEMRFNVAAVHGAIVKSAHLALFRIFGYGWALSPGGRYVAGALGGFARDKAVKDRAIDYFGAFVGAFTFLYNRTLPDDTLSSGLLLFHFPAGADAERGLDEAFGVSCLFNVNEKTLICTLPWGMEETGFSTGLSRYNEFLSDKVISQAVYAARRTGARSMDMKPLSMQYMVPTGSEPGTS